MPAQRQDKKNYIGIVSDTPEDERVAEAARSQRVMGYLVARLTAVLKRSPESTPPR